MKNNLKVGDRIVFTDVLSNNSVFTVIKLENTYFLVSPEKGTMIFEIVYREKFVLEEVYNSPLFEMLREQA